MARVRMKRVSRYSNEFKITAIRLASLPETLIRGVAKILDIHSFMLSRWKKEYREGKIIANKASAR
jgi:transposase